MAQESTPRQRVRTAIDQWGAEALVERCVDVLAGSLDADLALTLGGTSAPSVLGGNAARQLTSRASETAAQSLTQDEHPRVRAAARRALS